MCWRFLDVCVCARGCGAKNSGAGSATSGTSDSEILFVLNSSGIGQCQASV